jgi:hypothetical protein
MKVAKSRLGCDLGTETFKAYRSKNLYLNSSQAPSNPGNSDPAVIPITLNSRIMPAR